MALRAEAYYEAIGHELSAEAWDFAVREANREHTFFPSPSDLLELGRLFKRQAEPPVRRTEEQREEARRLAAEGMKLIEAEVAKLGAPVVKRMLELPAGEAYVVVSDIGDEARQRAKGAKP